jgi:predicted hotdog family 3-hydroxylacyl-ACP dehydratase
MTPIATQDLFNIVPHRPPMVWIDNVVECHDKGGAATTVLKKDGLYLTDGKLRESVAVELIAQTYAFCNAAYLRGAKSLEVATKRAFLAAIKDFKVVSWPDLPDGAELRTHVVKDRQFGPITLIHGNVYYKDQLLATGELKVFAD